MSNSIQFFFSRFEEQIPEVQRVLYKFQKTLSQRRERKKRTVLFINEKFKNTLFSIHLQMKYRSKNLIKY